LFATALEEGEIITALSFSSRRSGYAKFPHPASRFALGRCFVAKSKSSEVRVAVTGLRKARHAIPAMEAALTVDWSRPHSTTAISTDGLLSDLHGSSDYRAHLIKVMAQRALAV